MTVHITVNIKGFADSVQRQAFRKEDIVSETDAVFRKEVFLQKIN
jgi:hypothetical protein